jgi:Flp pilus assembly pilin Flp
VAPPTAAPPDGRRPGRAGGDDAVAVGHEPKEVSGRRGRGDHGTVAVEYTLIALLVAVAAAAAILAFGDAVAALFQEGRAAVPPGVT